MANRILVTLTNKDPKRYGYLSIKLSMLQISLTARLEHQYWYLDSRLVIVDYYSRWTWVKFLRHKDDSHSVFVAFCNQVQNEKDLRIVRVRSDHGGEFENGT